MLMTALNSALCSCYENTVSKVAVINRQWFTFQMGFPQFTGEPPSPDVSQRRGQLGSLIPITWMHEITHNFIRWRVADEKQFLTPDLQLGRRGESGWEFESLIFPGIIQAR